jgi:hypothetical protein
VTEQIVDSQVGLSSMQLSIVLEKKYADSLDFLFQPSISRIHGRKMGYRFVLMYSNNEGYRPLPDIDGDVNMSLSAASGWWTLDLKR